MRTCTPDTAEMLDRESASREAQVPEGRARKVRSDCKVSDAQLYDSIVAHFGILAYVAIAVGISRAALYKRVDRATELQAARDEARAVVVEAARDQLMLAVHAGKPWAVMFCLGTDGRSYTLVEPVEPREPKEPESPREPKAPHEPEAEPQLANAATLKLVRAVERGEAWAVKYCLINLEPGGQYAKKLRQPSSSAVPNVTPPRLRDERAAELAEASFQALTAEVDDRDEKALAGNAAAPTKGERGSSRVRFADPATTAPAITNPAPTKFVNAATLKMKFAPTVNGLPTAAGNDFRTRHDSCYDTAKGVSSYLGGGLLDVCANLRAGEILDKPWVRSDNDLPPSLRRKFALPDQEIAPGRSRYTRSILPVAAAPTLDIGIAPTVNGTPSGPDSSDCPPRR